MSLMMRQILEQPKVMRRASKAEREHRESFKEGALRKDFRLTVLVACGARISGPFRHTEKSAARVMSLPMYPEVAAEEVKWVADTVRA
jgi:dTDP-4-amino-4,6-dideoxygalactose transaminase